MEMVLIADASEEWRRILAEALGRQYQVLCCGSGSQALELALQHQPDVLILDLMLPDMDGLTLLKALPARTPSPCTIVTISYYSKYLAHAVSRLPVDFVTMKPCSVSAMVERVADLLSQRRTVPIQRLSPYDQVTALLISLSIPTSQSGFRYLRDGLLLLAENPNQQLTKVLYPDVGKPYGVNSIAVEKAIRTAITSAWNNRNEAQWRLYFAPAANGQLVKPTSGQFLTRLSDVITQASRRQA